MLIVGHTSSDDLGPINVAGDMVYVSQFTVPKDCLLSKLSAKLSGNGPTNGSQSFKGVVYDGDNALVATSAEVVVEDLSEAQWLDFIFDEPISLLAGDYNFGLHASGPSNASTLEMAAPSYADTVLELGDVGYCLPLAGGSGLSDIGPYDADGVAKGGATIGGIAAGSGPLIYKDLGATSLDGTDDGVTVAPIDRINYCPNPNGREMFKNGWTALGLVAEGPLTIPMPTPSFDRLGTTDFDGVDDQITTAYTTRRNLLTNPNFETNTTGWAASASGATISRVTSEFQDGAASLQVVHDGVAANRGAAISMVTVAPSLSYTASLYVKAPAGAALTLALSDFQADGTTLVGTTTQAYTGTGNWDRVSVTRTFGALGVKAYLNFYNTVAVARTWYVDSVLLEQAASAGTYFPTAAQLTSGDAGWTGTANASISEIGAFANGTSRTFSGWAWRDTNTTADVLIGSTSAGVLLRLNAGADTISFFPSNLGAAVTWAWPGSNQWVHWALVFNEAADTALLYINGALVSSQTQTVQWIPDPGAMTIGARSTIGADSFDGKLAHIGVNTSALTLAQIQNLYTASTKGGLSYWATLNGFTKVSFYASLASGGAGLTDLSTNAWSPNTAGGGVTVGGWRQSPEDDFGATDFDGTDDRITAYGWKALRNYFPDPSFEVTGPTWTGAYLGGTASTSSTDPYEGAQCGTITSLSNASGSGRYFTTGVGTADTGQTWKVSVRVKAQGPTDVGKVVSLYLSEANAAGSNIAGQSNVASVSLTEEWQELLVTRPFAHADADRASTRLVTVSNAFTWSVDTAFLGPIHTYAFHATGNEVQDSFAAKANGSPTTADTGQTYHHSYSTTSDAELRVVSGHLTNIVASGAGAGYSQLTLTEKVAVMGAKFKFNNTTAGSSIVLIAMEDSIAGGIVGGAQNSSFHYVVGPTAWAFQQIDAGTVTANIASGTYTALTADTEYTTEIILEDDRAYIQLPTGQMVVVNDSRIANNAPYAVWEVIQSNAATQAKGRFTEIWADSTPITSDELIGPFFPTSVQLAAGDAGWVGTANASESDYGPFANGTTRTFMGWANRDTSSGYDSLLFGRAFVGSAHANVAMSSGSGNITFAPDNSTTTTWTAAAPGNGVWFHWAVVFDEVANNASLYIDGELVSTQTNTGKFGGFAEIEIGGGSYFDGKQAWVSVHQSALTATQILAAKNASDYEATVLGFGGCSILLALDSKNLANDLSGNGRNGTGAGGVAIGGSYGIIAGRSSAAAKYGAYSISVKGDGVASANKFIRPDSDWQTIAAAAGSNITVSAWLYRPVSTTSSNYTFYLYWQTSGGSGVIPCSTTWSSVTANTWTRVSATFAVPAGTTTGSVAFAVPTEAVTAYWDGILIEQSDTVGTYFDGDYALDSGLELVRWAGTANNSFSYGGKVGWHTRTNKFYNPNLPAAITGWNSYAGYATVTWDATESVYDSGHSAKVVCPGANATEGLAIGTSVDPGSRWSPNKTYTASVWVKGTAGQAMFLQLGDYNQYGGFVGGGPYSYFTTTGEWQRISAKHATYDASYRTSMNLVTQTTPAAGFTFYAGGAMLEESPTMNSYFPTQAQVTSGEAGWIAAVGLSESQTGAFSAGAKRTFMGWAKRTDSASNDCLIGSTHPSTPFILRLEAGSQDVKIFPISGSSQTWTAAWPGNGVWTHWALTFQHTRGGAETVIAKLYINGVFVSSKTVAATIVMSGGAPTIGYRPSNLDFFNGQRAWESGHNRELTAAEIDYACDQGLPTTYADTYADGPEITLVPDPGNGEIGIFGTFAYPWSPPDETDLYLANLGYGSAQAALKGEGDRRTRRRVRAAWHGTSLDSQPQGASLAVVQRDGTLADLVGERLVISVGNRSTIVYVHRETDLDLDDDTQISLSRRAWQALSPLATDDLLVTTEVIGASVS